MQIFIFPTHNRASKVLMPGLKSRHYPMAEQQKSKIRAARHARVVSLHPSRRSMFFGVFLAMLSLQPVWAADPRNIAPANQIDQYNAQVPKTIVELQQLRDTKSIKISGPGGQQGVATLINLNPDINVWYLLELNWHAGATPTAYHLENPYPKRQRLLLDESHPGGITIAEGPRSFSCELWTGSAAQSLEVAKRSRAVYAPLCDNRLYVRNPTKGHRTAIEAVTDFLRDNIPGGEKVVVFVRDTFFKDAYREQAKTVPETSLIPQDQSQKTNETPAPALINPAFAGRLVVPSELGIHLQVPVAHGMRMGAWYAAEANPGVYVSVIQPDTVAPEILRSYTHIVNSLDSVESTSLVYLVAFDLDRFDLGFVIGSEHPRVEWSGRILEQMKDPDLPGPDGIGDIAPLVATGLINPVEADRTAATFTGGFKRIHGAFKSGELALKNHGSHYGFMQDGVVFSKLQPGLSTVFVRDDGRVELKTWTIGDNEQLQRINCARQNGVPIIDYDSITQVPVPGPLVGQWLPGNWAGSKDLKLRTLRAGLALQEKGTKRFLIYGYFSTATPSAMARVFQAYQCRYAMHLDLNALEHTYLAVYHREGVRLLIQHLIQGMSVLDKSDGENYIPRFLGYADNRDFFYVMRRDQPKETP